MGDVGDMSGLWRVFPLLLVALGDLRTGAKMDKELKVRHTLSDSLITIRLYGKVCSSSPPSYSLATWRRSGSEVNANGVDRSDSNRSHRPQLSLNQSE